MKDFPLRLALMLIGLVLLIVVAGLTVRSCDKRRAAAAQNRVERSQASAASNSAADAIGTVGAAAGRETASEALTRSNEQHIRAAQGANAPVDPAARDAGIGALCGRAAYQNDPRCKGAAK